MPSHRHIGFDIDYVYIWGWDKGNSTGFDMQQKFNGNTEVTETGNRLTTGWAGGNGDHNNIQPYIVTYMWKRIN